MIEAAMSLRRTLVGHAVSNKMDKTVTVLTENHVKYLLYDKYAVCSRKYHVHDEANQYNKSDKVEITESHPLPRMKLWVVPCLLEATRAI